MNRQSGRANCSVGTGWPTLPNAFPQRRVGCHFDVMTGTLDCHRAPLQRLLQDLANPRPRRLLFSGAPATGGRDCLLPHRSIKLFPNALPKPEHSFDSSRVLRILFRVEAKHGFDLGRNGDKVTRESSQEMGPTWVQNSGLIGLKTDNRSSKGSTFNVTLAEACGSRTHHPGREGQDQWL